MSRPEVSIAGRDVDELHQAQQAEDRQRSNERVASLAAFILQTLFVIGIFACGIVAGAALFHRGPAPITNVTYQLVCPTPAPETGQHTTIDCKGIRP